jgi:phosphoenolpyruvate synthase/pyruvate phosphate dikinase
LIKGVGANEGTANGVVVNINNYNDLEKVNTESIIVTTMTDQEMITAIKLARGIITNAGSSICHAALISKELNKPCIVGTRFATEQLLDGEKIQINGKTGEVHSILSLDMIDIHPEDDDFLNEKEQRVKKLWEEQRELREKGAVIINKREPKPTKIPEQIIFPKPKVVEEKITINVTIDSNGALNIKDLAKIDITKVKQIVIPIDQLFTQEEKSKLSGEYPGSVCMVTKEKIKKILKNIKDF